MDLLSFRDLYGYLSADKMAEIKALQAASRRGGPLAREHAEAALFGGGGAPPRRTTRAEASRVMTRMPSSAGRRDRAARRRQDALPRRTSTGRRAQRRRDAEGPRPVGQTMGSFSRSPTRDWGSRSCPGRRPRASSGQLVRVPRLASTHHDHRLLVAVVIINNAVMMATLQRMRGDRHAARHWRPTRIRAGMVLMETLCWEWCSGRWAALLGVIAVVVAHWWACPRSTNRSTFSSPAPACFPTADAANIVAAFLAVLVVTASPRSTRPSRHPRLARSGDANGRMTMLLRIALAISCSTAPHPLHRRCHGGGHRAVRVLIGLSNGIHDTIVETATTLMTGHVNVGGFFKVTAGQAGPVVTHYPKVLEVIKQERSGARLRGPPRPGLGQAHQRHRLDPERHRRNRDRARAGNPTVLQPEQGSLEGLKQPNTVVLFHDQAQRLGVKVGDSLTFTAVTLRGANNTVDVRVVAVCKDVGLLSTFNTFVPEQTLRDLYSLNDETTGALMLYLKNIDDMKPVQERLRKVLSEAGFGIMDDDPKAFWFKFATVTREAWTGQSWMSPTGGRNLLHQLGDYRGEGLERRLDGHSPGDDVLWNRDHPLDRHSRADPRSRNAPGDWHAAPQGDGHVSR